MPRKQENMNLIFRKEIGADDKDSGATVKEWEQNSWSTPDQTRPHLEASGLRKKFWETPLAKGLAKKKPKEWEGWEKIKRNK